MLDLRQLQALTAVSAEGSVARAAKRLGWSQPTVDHHLKALDREVGAPLVVRSSRGSALTAAGALMLERAGEILALSERALGDTREFSNVGRTRLKFGSFPTAAARLLPGVANRLRDVGIELDAVLEEIAPLVSRINQRTLDAALVYTASGYDLPFRGDVQTLPLLTDPLLLALPAHHPEAARDRFEPAALLELDGFPWVFSATPGDTLDDVVRDAFAGRRFEVAVRTDDYSVALGMVAAGMGIGLVPRLAAVNVPEGVRLRPIEDPRFAREILLAVPGPQSKEDSSPAIRQLAEAVRRTIETLSPPSEQLPR